MPNHVHGIIVITSAVAVGAVLVPAHGVPVHNGLTTRVAPTVGDIVGAFTSITTVMYTRGVKQSGWLSFHSRSWQRNYYEHIIRDDESLERIREYIANNPLQWTKEHENPTMICTTHASPQQENQP